MKNFGREPHRDGIMSSVKFKHDGNKHADYLKADDLKTALKRVRASGDHLRRFTEEFRSAGHTRSPVEAVKWSVRDHPIATIAIATAIGTLAGRLMRPH